MCPFNGRRRATHRWRSAGAPSEIGRSEIRPSICTFYSTPHYRRAASISARYKEGQKRQFAHTPDASACVVRCRRCLHGPRHRPSGTWLSSGIMPAPPAAAPSTRAPDHLHPLLVRCRLRRANTCARVFSCTGHCHDESDSLRHTGTCAVCRKLSDLSCLSPVQENTRAQVQPC